MLKNYIRVAFRNLWRHRAFAALNILGLTVGISACLLISLYVQFEWSYDRFNSKADRIFRVVSDIRTPSDNMHIGVTSPAMGVNIQSAFPEVEAFVRISPGSILVRKGDVKFQEDQTMFADSSLFRIFDFPLIYGNPQTALREPNSVVLSESAAKKYFGKSNPIGQHVLLTDGSWDAIVTGLMKDIPENSQIRPEMLVSMTTTNRFDSARDKQWDNFGWLTYILLKPNTNGAALEKKFPAMIEDRDGKEEKQNQMHLSMFLEPLADVHLRSTRGGVDTGNLNNVYVFAIIALFILFIACINFINLTTARSIERAKEVGIRKVVGAERPQLMGQFLGESIILCLISALLSIGICMALFSSFNQLAGQEIMTIGQFFRHPSYLIILFLLALGIGLLAGLYPALVLSSFRPILVLKGRFSSGSKGLMLRKALVITQFTISTGLIVATLVVYTQLHFMRNQDLGFSNRQTIVVDTHGDEHGIAYNQEVKGIGGVLSTAMSSSIPGGGNPGAYSMVQNKKGDMQIANLDLYFVDYDYIPQYKIKVLAGRAFSRSYATDTTHSMIINQAALKTFGYSSPEEALGRKFSQWGREGVIVGVIKDFHFRALQEEIKPLSMRIEPGGCSLLSVSVDGAHIPSVLAEMEKKWKRVIPYRPFSYYFADEFFDRQYRSEDRFGHLFFNFAILAIFISCLGLLGLASYSTLQRTREIGIRKVLGASVPSIVNLLSKEFLLLVGIAFLIATPLAWYGMHRWLTNFAYRISISWWMFVMAGLLAAGIALFTISFQAIRAALTNPVKSLRAE